MAYPCFPKCKTNTMILEYKQNQFSDSLLDIEKFKYVLYSVIAGDLCIIDITNNVKSASIERVGNTQPNLAIHNLSATIHIDINVMYRNKEYSILPDAYSMLYEDDEQYEQLFVKTDGNITSRYILKEFITLPKYLKNVVLMYIRNYAFNCIYPSKTDKNTFPNITTLYTRRYSDITERNKDRRTSILQSRYTFEKGFQSRSFYTFYKDKLYIGYANIANRKDKKSVYEIRFDNIVVCSKVIYNNPPHGYYDITDFTIDDPFIEYARNSFEQKIMNHVESKVLEKTELYSYVIDYTTYYQVLVLPKPYNLEGDAKVVFMRMFEVYNSDEFIKELHKELRKKYNVNDNNYEPNKYIINHVNEFIDNYT